MQWRSPFDAGKGLTSASRWDKNVKTADNWPAEYCYLKRRRPDKADVEVDRKGIHVSALG